MSDTTPPGAPPVAILRRVLAVNEIPREMDVAIAPGQIGYLPRERAEVEIAAGNARDPDALAPVPAAGAKAPGAPEARTEKPAAPTTRT